MNIKMTGINKSFGSNQVLKDAGFELTDGEVHALMEFTQEMPVQFLLMVKKWYIRVHRKLRKRVSCSFIRR